MAFQLLRYLRLKYYRSRYLAKMMYIDKCMKHGVSPGVAQVDALELLRKINALSGRWL